MRLSKAWIIARKDLAILRKNKQVLYSILALPIMVGVILPLIYTFSLSAGSSAISISSALEIVNLSVMFLLIIPVALPSVIGSYSIVGEKVEKSLEPLLATPTTDGELLLGKTLASLVPGLIITYIAAASLTVILDVWSITKIGIFILPSLNWVLILFLLSPLACLLSVEANVIISSRVSDVRAAQQLGSFILLPIILIAIFGGLFAGGTLLIPIVIAAVIGIIDVALFYVSKATFQREEILTKWK